MNRIFKRMPRNGHEHENVIVNFETLEDLLSIPFVCKYSKAPCDINFYKYAIDTLHFNDDSVVHLLLAFFDDGKSWLVIGRLDNVLNLNLPIAEYKIKDKK